MRKFLISIISIFIGFSVFAAGENVTTSKSYVDSILVPKQDIIEGTNDSPRVLTNTGTAGEYGTKDIYDSTDTYSGQMDALVDAATMNTAVQNAIDSEFTCIEYNPNDPTDCWLMDIRGKTEIQSPNLFDASKITNTSRIINNGNGSFTITTPSGDSGASTNKTLATLAPWLEIGKKYTLTIKSNPTGAKVLLYYFPDRTKNTSWSSGVSKTITQEMLDSAFYFSFRAGITYDAYDIQIEEGTTATPYQPYGNIYVPSGN